MSISGLGSGFSYINTDGKKETLGTQVSTFKNEIKKYVNSSTLVTNDSTKITDPTELYAKLLEKKDPAMEKVKGFVYDIAKQTSTGNGKEKNQLEDCIKAIYEVIITLSGQIGNQDKSLDDGLIHFRAKCCQDMVRFFLENSNLASQKSKFSDPEQLKNIINKTLDINWESPTSASFDKQPIDADELADYKSYQQQENPWETIDLSSNITTVSKKDSNKEGAFYTYVLSSINKPTTSQSRPSSGPQNFYRRNSILQNRPENSQQIDAFESDKVSDQLSEVSYSEDENHNLSYISDLEDRQIILERRLALLEHSLNERDLFDRDYVGSLKSSLSRKDKEIGRQSNLIGQLENKVTIQQTIISELQSQIGNLKQSLGQDFDVSGRNSYLQTPEPSSNFTKIMSFLNVEATEIEDLDESATLGSLNLSENELNEISKELEINADLEISKVKELTLSEIKELNHLKDLTVELTDILNKLNEFNNLDSGNFATLETYDLTFLFDEKIDKFETIIKNLPPETTKFRKNAINIAKESLVESFKNIGFDINDSIDTLKKGILNASDEGFLTYVEDNVIKQYDPNSKKGSALNEELQSLIADVRSKVKQQNIAVEDSVSQEKAEQAKKIILKDLATRLESIPDTDLMTIEDYDNLCQLEEQITKTIETESSTDLEALKTAVNDKNWSFSDLIWDTDDISKLKSVQKKQDGSLINRSDLKTTEAQELYVDVKEKEYESLSKSEDTILKLDQLISLNNDLVAFHDSEIKDKAEEVGKNIESSKEKIMTIIDSGGLEKLTDLIKDFAGNEIDEDILTNEDAKKTLATIKGKLQKLEIKKLLLETTQKVADDANSYSSEFSDKITKVYLDGVGEPVSESDSSKKDILEGAWQVAKNISQEPSEPETGLQGLEKSVSGSDIELEQAWRIAEEMDESVFESDSPKKNILVDASKVAQELSPEPIEEDEITDGEGSSSDEISVHAFTEAAKIEKQLQEDLNTPDLSKRNISEFTTLKEGNPKLDLLFKLRDAIDKSDNEEIITILKQLKTDGLNLTQLTLGQVTGPEIINNVTLETYLRDIEISYASTLENAITNKFQNLKSINDISKLSTQLEKSIKILKNPQSESVERTLQDLRADFKGLEPFQSMINHYKLTDEANKGDKPTITALVNTLIDFQFSADFYSVSKDYVTAFRQENKTECEAQLDALIARKIKNKEADNSIAKRDSLNTFLALYLQNTDTGFREQDTNLMTSIAQKIAYLEQLNAHQPEFKINKSTIELDLPSLTLEINSKSKQQLVTSLEDKLNALETQFMQKRDQLGTDFKSMALFIRDDNYSSFVQLYLDGKLNNLESHPELLQLVNTTLVLHAQLDKLNTLADTQTDLKNALKYVSDPLEDLSIIKDAYNHFKQEGSLTADTSPDSEQVALQLYFKNFMLSGADSLNQLNLKTFSKLQGQSIVKQMGLATKGRKNVALGAGMGKTAVVAQMAKIFGMTHTMCISPVPTGYEPFTALNVEEINTKLIEFGVDKVDQLEDFFEKISAEGMQGNEVLPVYLNVVSQILYKDNLQISPDHLNIMLKFMQNQKQIALENIEILSQKDTGFQDKLDTVEKKYTKDMSELDALKNQITLSGGRARYQGKVLNKKITIKNIDGTLFEFTIVCANKTFDAVRSEAIAKLEEKLSIKKLQLETQKKDSIKRIKNEIRIKEKELEDNPQIKKYKEQLSQCETILTFFKQDGTMFVMDEFDDDAYLGGTKDEAGLLRTLQDCGLQAIPKLTMTATPIRAELEIGIAAKLLKQQNIKNLSEEKQDKYKANIVLQQKDLEESNRAPFVEKQAKFNQVKDKTYNSLINEQIRDMLDQFGKSSGARSLLHLYNAKPTSKNLADIRQKVEAQLTNAKPGTAVVYTEGDRTCVVFKSKNPEVNNGILVRYLGPNETELKADSKLYSFDDKAMNFKEDSEIEDFKSITTSKQDLTENNILMIYWANEKSGQDRGGLTNSKEQSIKDHRVLIDGTNFTTGSIYQTIRRDRCHEIDSKKAVKCIVVDKRSGIKNYDTQIKKEMIEMQDQKEIQFASQRFEQKIQTHAKGTVLAKLDEIDFMSSIKNAFDDYYKSKSKQSLANLMLCLKELKSVTTENVYQDLKKEIFQTGKFKDKLFTAVTNAYEKIGENLRLDSSKRNISFDENDVFDKFVDNYDPQMEPITLKYSAYTHMAAKNLPRAVMHEGEIDIDKDMFINMFEDFKDKFEEEKAKLGNAQKIAETQFVEDFFAIAQTHPISQPLTDPLQQLAEQYKSKKSSAGRGLFATTVTPASSTFNPTSLIKLNNFRQLRQMSQEELRNLIPNDKSEEESKKLIIQSQLEKVEDLNSLLTLSLLGKSDLNDENRTTLINGVNEKAVDIIRSQKDKLTDTDSLIQLNSSLDVLSENINDDKLSKTIRELKSEVNKKIISLYTTPLNTEGFKTLTLQEKLKNITDVENQLNQLSSKGIQEKLIPRKLEELSNMKKSLLSAAFITFNNDYNELNKILNIKDPGLDTLKDWLATYDEIKKDHSYLSGIQEQYNINFEKNTLVTLDLEKILLNVKDKVVMIEKSIEEIEKQKNTLTSLGKFYNGNIQQFVYDENKNEKSVSQCLKAITEATETATAKYESRLEFNLNSILESVSKGEQSIADLNKSRQNIQEKFPDLAKTQEVIKCITQRIIEKETQLESINTFLENPDCDLARLSKLDDSMVCVIVDLTEKNKKTLIDLFPIQSKQPGFSETLTKMNINNLKALGLKEMNLKLIEEARNKEQAEVGVLKENFECLGNVAKALHIEFDSISKIFAKKDVLKATTNLLTTILENIFSKPITTEVGKIELLKGVCLFEENKFNSEEILQDINPNYLNILKEILPEVTSNSISSISELAAKKIQVKKQELDTKILTYINVLTIEKVLGVSESDLTAILAEKAKIPDTLDSLEKKDIYLEAIKEKKEFLRSKAKDYLENVNLNSAADVSSMLGSLEIVKQRFYQIFEEKLLNNELNPIVEGLRTQKNKFEQNLSTLTILKDKLKKDEFNEKIILDPQIDYTQQIYTFDTDQDETQGALGKLNITSVETSNLQECIERYNQNVEVNTRLGELPDEIFTNKAFEDQIKILNELNEVPNLNKKIKDKIAEKIKLYEFQKEDLIEKKKTLLVVTLSLILNRQNENKATREQRIQFLVDLKNTATENDRFATQVDQIPIDGYWGNLGKEYIDKRIGTHWFDNTKSEEIRTSVEMLMDLVEIESLETFCNDEINKLGITDIPSIYNAQDEQKASFLKSDAGPMRYIENYFENPHDPRASGSRPIPGDPRDRNDPSSF